MTEQNQPSKGQINTEIAKILGCLERDDKIKELQEGHQMVQQFTAADKMGPSAATENPKGKPVELLEFECSKKGWEVHDYFKSNNIKSFDVTIWINGRIDLNKFKEFRVI